jgi:hypothetical protein
MMSVDVDVNTATKKLIALALAVAFAIYPAAAVAQFTVGRRPPAFWSIPGPMPGPPSPPSQAVAAGITTLSMNETWAGGNIGTACGGGIRWFNGIWYQSPAPTINITTTANVLGLRWNSANQGNPWNTTLETIAPNGGCTTSWSPPFYLEVRMSHDSTPSDCTWPALWFLSNSQVVGQPGHGAVNFLELDLYEWQGQIPNTFNGHIHLWNPSGSSQIENNNAHSTWTFPGGTNLAAYNTYGVLVTPSQITWYFNNVAILTANATTYPQSFAALTAQGMYFMIGNQVGCNWVYGDGVPLPYNQVMKSTFVHVWI